MAHGNNRSLEVTEFRDFVFTIFHLKHLPAYVAEHA